MNPMLVEKFKHDLERAKIRLKGHQEQFAVIDTAIQNTKSPFLVEKYQDERKRCVRAIEREQSVILALEDELKTASGAKK